MKEFFENLKEKNNLIFSVFGFLLPIFIYIIETILYIKYSTNFMHVLFVPLILFILNFVFLICLKKDESFYFIVFSSISCLVILGLALIGITQSFEYINKICSEAEYGTAEWNIANNYILVTNVVSCLILGVNIIIFSIYAVKRMFSFFINRGKSVLFLIMGFCLPIICYIVDILLYIFKDGMIMASLLFLLIYVIAVIVLLIVNKNTKYFLILNSIACVLISLCNFAGITSWLMDFNELKHTGWYELDVFLSFTALPIIIFIYNILVGIICGIIKIIKRAIVKFNEK